MHIILAAKTIIDDVIIINNHVIKTLARKVAMEIEILTVLIIEITGTAKVIHNQDFIKWIQLDQIFMIEEVESRVDPIFKTEETIEVVIIGVVTTVLVWEIILTMDQVKVAMNDISHDYIDITKTFKKDT